MNDDERWMNDEWKIDTSVKIERLKGLMDGRMNERMNDGWTVNGWMEGSTRPTRYDV